MPQRPNDDRRDGCQQVDDVAERLRQATRGVVRDEEGDRHGERHGHEQRERATAQTVPNASGAT